MADELDALTRDELLDMAKAQDVKGRSNMSKEELVEALATKQNEGVQPTRQSPDPLQGVRLTGTDTDTDTDGPAPITSTTP